MKIILFTTPVAGKHLISKLIDQGFPPSFVVPPNRDDPNREELIKLAHRYNIPVLMFDKSPQEEAFVARVKEIAPDLILVATFPSLLPKDVYSCAKIAAINAHGSLLPKYRGNNPIFHVIMNGEKETGLTLHLLDDTFDTGDMLKKTIIPITLRETSGSLQNKLILVIATELADMVTTINKTGLPQAIKQVSIRNNPPAPRVIPPLKKIDWSKSAIYIDRFIRAANPFFLVQNQHKENIVTIHSGRLVNNSEVINTIAGTIISINKEGMLVSTGSSPYLITSISYDNYWCGDPLGLQELGVLSLGDRLVWDIAAECKVEN